MDDVKLLADRADGLSTGRRRWIDLLLVVSGVALAVAGWPIVGAALVALGMVTPLLRWSGRRRHDDVYHPRSA